MKKATLTALLAIVFCAAATAESGYRLHRSSTMNAVFIKSGETVFWGDGFIGMNEWWEAFGCDPTIHNRGISGQSTANMLEDVDKIGNSHPSKLFIMAGASDLMTGGLDNPERIADNFTRIVEGIGRISPETEIYIQSILPTMQEAISDQGLVLRTNALLEEICRNHFHTTFINLHQFFIDSETGFIKPEYTYDGIHLNGKGYAVWCHEIAEYVGRQSVLGDEMASEFSGGPINANVMARVTVNSRTPLFKDDILLFGNETVCAGEWYELMKSSRVKNRGCGWARNQTTISDLASAVAAAFSSGNPGQIMVYAGSADAVKGRLDLFREDWNNFADSLTKYARGASITVSTLAPMRSAKNENVDVVPFNEEIKRIAEERGFGLFDAFSALTDAEGRPEPSFFIRGLLTGKGYKQLASRIAVYYGLQDEKKNVLDISVTRYSGYTGRGNSNQKLQTAEITGNTRSLLRSVSVRVDALPTDVAWLHLTYNGKIIRSAKVVEGKKFYTFKVWKIINRESTLDISADITPDAVEGHRISAEILDIRGTRMSEGNRFYPGAGTLEILRTRSMVFAHNDFGGMFWRNAALSVLADSTLVAISDRMYTGEEGLPNNCDVCCRISSDGGNSWGETICLAQGGGYGRGYSGAAVATAGNGDLIALFTGGLGHAVSGADKSSSIYTMRSRDGGRTWDELTDITNQIRDVRKYPELAVKDFAAISTGSALTLRDGTVMAFLSCGKPFEKKDVYAVMTSDNGCNWTIEGPVMRGAEWAGAAILGDGSILCSACEGDMRKWSRSANGGMTWTDGYCNEMQIPESKTDILRLSDGMLVMAMQEDFMCERVCLYISTDDGRTWHRSKYICKCETSGTSLKEMPDGSIGIYTEERNNNTCRLWFMNVSREWLMRQ